MKIVNPDKGEIPFKPYDYQKELLKTFAKNRYSIALCSRQSGKTTIVAIYVLWYAMFNEDKNIGIVSNKESSAKMILSRLKRMYEGLPNWLKPGVNEYSKTFVAFDNNTRIVISATSADAFRGQSMNCITGDSYVCVINDNDEIFYTRIDDLNIGKLCGYIGRGKDLKCKIEKYGIEKYEIDIDKNIIRENIYHSKMQVLTRDGFKKFDRIISNGISDKIINITLSNGKNIKCTKDHRILKNNNIFEQAKDLNIGDELYYNIFVENIEIQNKPEEVFDIINVEDTNSFVTNGIEVHNCLVMDEFAFVPSHQAEEFWAANYPTISASKTAKIIIISTPNGLFNRFHTLWVQSEAGLNTFVGSRISWERVPGRDKKWAEEQRKNLGEIQFAQEFAVEFLGSTNTLISAKVLEYLLAKTEEPKETDLNGRLRIFEKPNKDSKYTLGVDPAKGTGENSSTIQVLRMDSINPIKMEQVAVFEDNLTDIYDFTEIVNRISYYYNNAFIMCENNGEGSAVVQRLWWEYENENLVNTGNKADKLGIRSTVKTKPRSVLLMKKLIEDGSLILHDRETIEQLGSFVEENGKFFGKDKPDDLISALYWACFVLEMNVLDESYGFIKEVEDEDLWGILQDVEPEEEDWSWLTDDMFQIE